MESTTMMNDLSEALTEALELSKCSICLDEVVDAVLLWPCAHCFCKICATTHQRGNRAEKSRCPLCNAFTSRRSIVQFEGIHTLYKECLDQLIGSLSLDIGFDITSYKSNKCELLNKESNTNVINTDRQTSHLNKTHSRHPLQGTTRTGTNRSMRSHKRSDKSDRILKNGQFSLGEKGKLQKVLTEDNAVNYSLPNSKKEKVHNWIVSSKFSQAEPEDVAHTVVAQVHREGTQNEQTGLSEDTQLQSVTQSDTKSVPEKKKSKFEALNTQSDIEAIKPFDKFISQDKIENSVNNKTILTSSDEKFDRLLGTKGRSHRITTTYGSKIPTSRLGEARPRSFPFEDGLFQSMQEVSDGKPSTLSENQTNSTGNNISKDFSSGSGEEWIPESYKNERQVKIDDHLTNNQKNKSIKPMKTKKELYTDDKLNFKKVSMNIDDKKVEVLKEKANLVSESALDVKISEVSSVSVTIEQKLENHDVLREITTEGNNESLNKVSNHASKKGIAVDNDCNNMIKRSPGWSKLTTTKKEFHMSEKKKLNLKTISKAKPHSPLSKLSKDVLQVSNNNSNKTLSNLSKTPTKSFTNISINEKFDKQVVNSGFEQNSGIELSTELQKNKSVFPENSNALNETRSTALNELQRDKLDISTSTLNGSPFKGFASPNECENREIHKILGTQTNESSSNEIVKNVRTSMSDTNLWCKKYLPAHGVIERKEEGTPNKSTYENDELKESNAVCKNPQTYISKDDQCSAKIHTVRKRDRDEEKDAFNDSAFYSPVQKKMCVDAQIQTSPGRAHSLVKDFIKDICRLEENTVLEEKNLEQDLSDKIMSLVAEKIKVKESLKCSNYGSESYYRGNIISENNILSPEKCFNDSDIVLGTEQSNTGVNFRSNWLATEHKGKDLDLRSTLVYKCGEIDDVDYDAVTQPYKTPVGPRRESTSLTEPQSSVVSNPTQSELKKAADEFDQTHCLQIPGSTLKVTPWNESGIGQLQGLSTDVDKDRDILKHSPTLKEKSNKSRRHLEFTKCSKSGDDSTSRHSPENMVLSPSKNKRTDLSIVQNVEKDMITESPRQRVLSTEESIYPTSKQQSSPQNNADLSTSLKMPRSFDQNEILCNDEIEGNVNCRHTYLEKIKEGGAFEAIDSKISSKEDQNISLGEIEAAQICSDDEEAINSTNEDLFIQATPEFTRPELKDHVQSCDKQPELIEHEELHETAKDETVKEQEPPDVSLVQVEESNSEESTEPAKQPDSYCFASSLLTPDQNRILRNVLNGLGIPFSSAIGNHISHLIVGTIDGCFQNTYKVLYAMAMHKPVISYDWVVQVVKTGGTVPLDPFIALDPKGECSVLRARNDVNRLLLKGFAIHVYNVMDNLIKKEQAEEMIQLCGGTVVPQLPDFHVVPRNMLRIIILSEPPDPFTQGDWRSKYSAAAVIMDWLYGTVGQYKVSPLLPFMLNPDEAVQFLRREGYPENLLFG